MIDGLKFFSGIDTQAILDKQREVLTKVKVSPIEAKAQEIQGRNKAVLEISDLVSNFKTELNNLFSESSLNLYNTSVSNPNILTANASADAVEGVYYVKVNQLATVDQYISNNGVANPYTDIILSNGESFTINFGSQTLTINATSDMTLNQLIDSINSEALANNINLSASSLLVGGQYKLLLTGTETGSTYSFSNITITDTSSPLYGTNGDISDYTQIQVAQDAEIEFGASSPILITKNTNEINDLIPGVTINLKDITTSPVIIEVKPDTESIKTKIHNFVDAYNSLVNKIKTYSDYDIDTDTAGPLFGDAGINMLKESLYNLISTTVDIPGSDLKNIFQLGIYLDTEGKLEIRGFELDYILRTNFDDIKLLFSGDSSNQGLIKRMTDTIENITDGTTGIIPLIQSKYENQLNLLKEQYEKAQKEVDREIERMQQEFLKMEKAKAELLSLQQTLESYFKVPDND